MLVIRSVLMHGSERVDNSIVDGALYQNLAVISLKPATVEHIGACLRKTYQVRLGPILKADVELQTLYTIRQALIQKNLSGVYSHDIFKEQNKFLEYQIKTIHISKNETIIKKYNIEAITAFKHAKFTDLNKSYLNSTLKQKNFYCIRYSPLVWTYPGTSNTGISHSVGLFLMFRKWVSQLVQQKPVGLNLLKL